MSTESILTLEQAAEYLQIPADDLQRELEQGRIPGRKLAGKWWRINRDALDRFLAQPETPLQNQVPTNNQDTIIDTVSEPEVRIDEKTGTESTIETRKKDVSLEINVSTDGNNTVSTAKEGTDSEIQPVVVLSSEPVATDEKSKGAENTEDTAKPSGYSLDQDRPSWSSEERNPVSKSTRTTARVFRYNPDEGFGYARTTDNRTVYIDSKHLVSLYPTPFPGDIIEFEWCLSKKGRPEPGAIQVLERNRSRPVSTVQQIEIPEQSTARSATSNRANSESAFELKSSNRHPYAHPHGTKESQRLYELAALANTEGRYDDARKLFRDAISSGAGIQVYTVFFKMELNHGTRQAAIKIIEHAIKTFPQHAIFHDMYGHMERRARKYLRAVEIFRKGLRLIPGDFNLKKGLAQTLVQIGTEESLTEAGSIFKDLERIGKLNKSDGIYRRFQWLQRNPRANNVYEFFQNIPGTKVGIAGQRDLPSYITDIIVEMSNQEFQESFGVSGGILVRCFQRQATQAQIVNLRDYLSKLSPNDLIGLREGREVVVNRSIAFLAIPNSDVVRDQIMSILSESSEAIIPIDDSVLQTTSSEDMLGLLRDLLGQYLGQRDLYNSTGPVYGVPGRRFFGRERLLVQLADDINRGQFIGVYGLRKMGKTSLVYQLRDEKLQGDAVAYVDLQSSDAQSTRSCAPLYYELERDLYIRLINREPNAASLLKLGKYKRFSDLPLDSSSISLTFAEDMRVLLDELSESKISSFKRVVIVLDELERILPVSDQGGIQGYLEFFGLIRGLMQTERYRGLLSSVVVAANASISERGYWESRENPVFALYKTVFLPPFSEEECVEMIRTLGQGMSVRWEDEAVKIIFSETGGHPFLTRLFCSRIIQHYRTRPLIVTAEMVRDQIVPFIRSEGSNLEQITELLHRNFPEEEEFLLQIALDEAPDNLPDESLRHLLGYHLIYDEGTSYRISLNLLRRWIRRRAGVKDE
jgi:excisionase family DNA binding protein